MSVEFESSQLTPRQQYANQNWGSIDQSNNSLKKKSKSLQEQDLLKAAKDGDFVQSLSELALVEHGQNSSNKKPRSPGDVRLLNLQQRRLQDISVVDLCQRLEICNLSNNLIFDIDPLKWCRNLFCLDVHSNQINHLPGKQFWSSLMNLTILDLHDNGVSRLEELKYLAHSASLCYLALYDSPISLMKNYRHCAVNAVFTLKVLDNHVVSDEEIIEDAKFRTERFKALKQQFMYFPKYCALKQMQSMSYDDTMKVLNADLAKINIIQSKYCPVIILQKCIRGFLVRLKYSYIRDTRLWAAVSIQRFYRSWKGHPIPPPSSPNLHYQDYLYKSLSSIRLDYETYLKLRRSKHRRSTLSMKSEKPLPFRVPYFSERENLGKDFLTRNKPLQRHISINLQKLQGQSTEILDNKTILKLSIDHSIPHKGDYSYGNAYIDSLPSNLKTQQNNVKLKPLSKDVEEIAKNLGLSSIPIDGRKKPLPRIGKYYTQHAFLGELDTLKEKLDEQNDDDMQFRLTVQKPYVMLHDALEELILRTVEGADDIRQSTKEIDRMVKSAPPKFPARLRHKEKDRVQELFLKSRTNMGFSIFKAVDKAYQDRNKAELLLKRSRHVKQIKEQQKTGKVKVTRHKRNYKNEACSNKHTERVHVLEELEAKRTRELIVRDKTAAMRMALAENQEKARRSYKFALDFGSQIASVGKALASHSVRKRQEEIQKRNKKLVTELRNELKDKRTLVEGYRQQQKVIRQNDTIAMKEDLDFELLKNTVKREVELRERLIQHQEKSLRQLRSPTVLGIRELHPTDTKDTKDALNDRHFPLVLPEI